MKQKLPELLKRKIAIDHYVTEERKKEVVDFEEFKKLKKLQRQVFDECKAKYGPK